MNNYIFLKHIRLNKTILELFFIKKHLLLFGGVYEFGYELLGVRNSQSVSVKRERSEITKVIPLSYSGLVIFGGFNLESIVVEILSFS